jgi:hypothetical protein
MLTTISTISTPYRLPASPPQHTHIPHINEPEMTSIRNVSGSASSAIYGSCMKHIHVGIFRDRVQRRVPVVLVVLVF